MKTLVCFLLLVSAVLGASCTAPSTRLAISGYDRFRDVDAAVVDSYHVTASKYLYALAGQQIEQCPDAACRAQTLDSLHRATDALTFLREQSLLSRSLLAATVGSKLYDSQGAAGLVLKSIANQIEPHTTALNAAVNPTTQPAGEPVSMVDEDELLDLEAGMESP